MKEKYEPIIFDAQHDGENLDERYERLLKAFRAKVDTNRHNLRKQIETLETASKQKIEQRNNQLNADIKDINKSMSEEDRIKAKKEIRKAEKDIPQVKQKMEEFLKNHFKNVNTLIDNIEYLKNSVYIRKEEGEKTKIPTPLIIGGYPTKEYLIELLARLITDFDDPNNDTNREQLHLLANEIPEDSKGYWPHLKRGVIFITTEAAILGIIFGAIALTASLAMPPVAVAFAFILLSMPPVLIGSYLMAEETIEIEHTRTSQEIQKIITDARSTFFVSKIEDTSTEDGDDEVHDNEKTP